MFSIEALSTEIAIICQGELLPLTSELSGPSFFFCFFFRFQPSSLTSSPTKASKCQHLLLEIWKCWLHIVLGARLKELLTFNKGSCHTEMSELGLWYVSPHLNTATYPKALFTNRILALWFVCFVLLFCFFLQMIPFLGGHQSFFTCNLFSK